MRKTEEFFHDGKVSTIAVITMRGLIAASDNDEIKAWMSKLDMTIADDADILHAGDITTRSRIKEVEGHAFASEFFKKLIRGKKTIFLISKTSDSLDKLTKEVLAYQKNIKIVGAMALDDVTQDDDFVVNEINIKMPDVLISNLESPLREKFMDDHQMKLNAAIWMMVRPDASLGMHPVPFWQKISDFVLKKKFHIRLNKYKEEQLFEQNDEENIAPAGGENEEN